ncbi:MAG: shikimate dehydrogenase [Gammaproteobacteria bacterium]|nr:shikimate dehydrogenase [Gammaproteobacteria bacterium]
MEESAPDRYGVVGFPVSHSRSPFIHGMFARQTAQNMEYRLYEIPPVAFRTEVGRFFAEGGSGLNVTVPHKVAAADFATELTPRAERAGAVNTLAMQHGRVLGDNTDGTGLVRDLTANLQIEMAEKRVLILGAGGATRGILGPLLELGLDELVVANRTAERARDLVTPFSDLGKVRGCGYDDLPVRPFDLVIHATSAGLEGKVPKINPAVIGPATVCYDLSYGKGDTPFVKWAWDQGCARAVEGWGMLVEQAAESFALWRGVRPDTAPVLAVLESKSDSFFSGK